MKALILAAGYGTRLYPLVVDTPKPLLTVNGKALIEYILDRLSGFDELDEVYVVTNEKFFANFQVWAKDCKGHHFKITVVSDGTKSNEDRLGSVGDIHFVIKNKRVTGDLLVVGGDNLFDFDLKAFYTFCRTKPKGIFIGAYDIHSIADARKFGVVELAKDGRIISFAEKPDNPRSSLIAMCLYYFSKGTVNLAFDYLAESQKADKAGDYIRWLSERQEVYGYVFKGTWYDIGSIESYNEAQEKFKSK